MHNLTELSTLGFCASLGCPLCLVWTCLSRTMPFRSFGVVVVRAPTCSWGVNVRLGLLCPNSGPAEVKRQQPAHYPHSVVV